MQPFTSTDSGATVLSKLNTDIVPKLTETIITVGTQDSCDYICDGVEDDIQIQAAIDAVVAAGGGIVQLRNGTYNTTTELEITNAKPLIFQGEGRTTVIKPASGINGFNINTTSGPSIGLVMRDFRITGTTGTLTGITFPSSDYEVTLFTATNVAIDHCDTQIYVGVPFGGVFTNCAIEYGTGSDIGIYFYSGAAVLNKCWFEGLELALKMRGSANVVDILSSFNGNTANYELTPALGYYPSLMKLPFNYYAKGNVTGATTFDIANGSTIAATLTGAITATLAAGRYRGEMLKLILTQGGTGSYGYTKDATNKLAGGSITLSTAVGAIDIIEFVWNGALWEEVSRSLNLS